MTPWVRWAILAATPVAVVVLFVVLSPGGTTEDGSATPSTSTSETSTASVSEEPGIAEIEAEVEGGTLDGPTRATVGEGETVLISVRSDAADEVHVHGYDLTSDVAPGEPARIRFVADLPGLFEVELEDSGRLLFQLEVTP